MSAKRGVDIQIDLPVVWTVVPLRGRRHLLMSRSLHTYGRNRPLDGEVPGQVRRSKPTTVVVNPSGGITTDLTHCSATTVDDEGGV